MNYVAEVVDDLVVRVVVSPDTITPPDGWVVVGKENTVGIGWLYVDGEFMSPHDEESPA